VAKTRERVDGGETIVAVQADIVGIVTLKGPGRDDGAAFYRRADVAMFGQFAVRPSRQRCGIGSMLLGLVERRATEIGAAYLALDTSEHARELITMYESNGYGFVEHWTWDSVNYRSVVLAKSLRPSSERA
jgi:GNAT superfamily N-acetyltransferase